MSRSPRPYCRTGRPTGRPPSRARARARHAFRHRRGSVPVLPLVTGLAVVGATAAAWAGGSPDVRAAATLTAAVAAVVLATRRRARDRAVPGPRALGSPVLRRATHRVTAALVLVLVLPLLLAVALAVELTSRGPVLLRRVRAGSGPTLAFRCTDRLGRTTALGGVLQRCALEDLPGLLDVVAGRMVVSGPPLARTGRAPTRRTGGRLRPR